ncbi:MAG: YybH family protein [Gemmatimonadales bacterium]
MSRLPVQCLLGALLIASCAPKAPQGLTDQDRAAIRQSEADFAASMLAKDFAKVAASYTADAVVLPANGPAATGRAAIEQLLNTFPPLTAFTLNSAEIEGLGDLAYQRGTFLMTMQLPGGVTAVDSGKYLEIRRRQGDGSWLITRDIWNSDIPLPEPPPPMAGKKGT